jgi:hypothetical protein
MLMINISKPKKKQGEYLDVYWELSALGQIAGAFGRAGGA